MIANLCTASAGRLHLILPQNESCFSPEDIKAHAKSLLEGLKEGGALRKRLLALSVGDVHSACVYLSDRIVEPDSRCLVEGVELLPKCYQPFLEAAAAEGLVVSVLRFNPQLLAVYITPQADQLVAAGWAYPSNRS